ncbi:Asp-tRNA(Asn)/Glu-tRNA(Gln) amidotransferase subunit GatA [Mycoplasma mycoides subsp. capri]|uniref:amidase family protein n=1 Tax=Mycoplasma mycoides TaxID=2102 RepID=UPI0010181CBA|nr:amidase family protein [Mycoplasma mycoides]SRX61844.1 Asp-tRNA(Asn)/Glu-tRNA(Gln) amidotransferase subunit GatA [Mycoplasma mycoides subsp. capri]
MQDYRKKSIFEIHKDLVDKKYTVLDLTKEVLKNLKYELDSNAINYLAEIHALKQAKKIEENFDSNNLLSGIPYICKDNFSTKDIPTTASSKILENYIPNYSAALVDSLEKNQSILVGKSALDELGMGGTGLLSCNGKITNPWDKNRIVGGSSSGSAYLVAKGLVPFATGTDTGDSIRKPASYNGIVGFKPTYGVISRYGLLPYDASYDDDNRDFSSTTADHVDFLKQIDDFSNIKTFGYISSVIESLDQEHKTHYYNLFETLKNKGYQVKALDFRQDLLDAVLPVYLMIANSESVSTNSCLDGIKYGKRVDGNDYSEIMINSRTQGFGEIVRRRFAIGSLVLKGENQKKYLVQAKKVRTLINRDFNNLFEQVDVLLLPPSPSIAPLIEEINNPNKKSQEKDFIENILVLANFTGSPSITIPFFKTKNMPVGINITTKVKTDLLTLQAAKLLENIIGIKNQIVED